MTQGLRRRPATIRRLGIGLVLFGAAVGCQGTDRLPASNLSPPPRLPSSLPAPSVGPAAPAARTVAPSATPPGGQTTSWNGEMPARAGLTQTGGVQPAPIARPTLPTTGGTLPLVPPDAPTGGRGSPPPPPEPTAPAYQPPTVLQNPTPPPPPVTSSAAPATPVSPPTTDVVPAAPALPSSGGVAVPASPIAAPSLPLGGN
jgi:hypothetical protein